MVLGLDDQLYNRLLNIEDELLIASEGNHKTMKSFVERLTDIRQAAARAIAENSLTKRTAALIRCVASTGSILAKTASGVERIGASVEQKRREQLEVALGRLTLEEEPVGTAPEHVEPEKCTSGPHRLSAVPTDPDPLLSHKRAQTSVPTVPHHVSHSYEWLHQHLHDPYPPPPVKKRIASQAGVSEKVVNDWFVNVRRKIGWTAIMNKHFNKCRALTIDSARVVLLEERAKVPICEELRNAFLTMKKTADQLFDKRFKISATAKQLDFLAIDGRSVDRARGPDNTTPKHDSQKNTIDGSNRAGHLKRRRLDEGEVDRVVAKRAKPNECSEMGIGPVLCEDGLKPSESLSTHRLDRQRAKHKRHFSAQSLPSPQLPSESSTSSKFASLREAEVLQHTGPIWKGSTSPSLPLSTPSRNPSRKRRLSFVDESAPLKRPRGLPEVSDVCDPGDVLTAARVAPASDERKQVAPKSSDLSLAYEPLAFADILDLPVMPTFDFGEVDIQAPSMEPFPSSSGLFISYPGLDETNEHWSPVSSVFDDSQSFSSLELDFPPELKLNVMASDSTAIQDPAYDVISPSDLFQEMLRIDKEAKVERSRKLEEKQDTVAEHFRLAQDHQIPQA